jgi:hypothetical protein
VPGAALERVTPGPSAHLSPLYGAVLAAQRGAGNAAVSRLVGGRAGAGLPAGNAAAATLLGPLVPEVRVHQGAAADARLAAHPGALAVTEGTDIHLSSQAPALDSPSGRMLMAHEAAHVVQQRATGALTSAERAEAEADEAMVAASLGRRPAALSPARGPQFFEAPKHAASLKTAMDRHGFTDAEQDAAYFGNWCRDLSQALVPTLEQMLGRNATFQVVNLMAIRQFGHGVTPAQLGAYSTREHIDNPAGTTDHDILAESKRTIAGYSDGPDPITGTPSNTARTTGAEDLKPENIAASFAVDASGVPRYITRSKEYILEEFDAAAAAGRTKTGLYHLGNLSHTCEDLFAHSNWVEMALGRLIGEGKVTIPPEAAADVKERTKAGLPPIEDYAAQAVDTAGNARPILTTGTFTGSSGLKNKTGNDTFISLAEEVKNMVDSLNPFEESGEAANKWDFAMEILHRMDAAGDEGSLGPIMLGVLEPLLGSIDDMAKSLTSAPDDLKKGARDLGGPGPAGDVAEGAAGLVGKGVHAVVDPAAASGKEGVKALITGVANQIGTDAVSLAELAVWYQRAEGRVAAAWQSLKDGVRGLPEALRELILPKLVEAERNFKKEVHRLGGALYNKAARSLLSQLQQAATPTQVKETNVDQKFHVWAADLSSFMKKKLEEVGGSEGAKLAAEVPAATPDENIPVLITYAESAFASTLRRLLKAAEADAILEQTGEQAHQLKQLQNVPEWARAGASHSQIAKDHATSPFFGLAFAVANVADDTLVGWMKRSWGDTGPAPGLEKNFGEKETVRGPDGKPVTRQKLGPDGRPVLKDEEGLSEWEKEARKRFLENRVEGEKTVKDGVAPDEKIGPALVGMADRLVKIVQAYPVLGPIFDETIATIRKDPDNQTLLRVLETAEKRFDEYAKSGKLDDGVMDEIDVLIARARALASRHEEHHHDEGGGGGDVHSKKQIDLINKYRGVDPATKKARRDAQGQAKGVQVDHLKAAVTVGQKADADAAAEKISEPRARFKAEVDRIFGHPYDSNWWVPTVQAWADANQHVLADYIKDRNSGKSDVH